MTDPEHYRIQSDECAEAARRHAAASAEFHRQLVDLYGKPAKSTDDWQRVSAMIVQTNAGYAAANVWATLALRAATLATTERL